MTAYNASQWHDYFFMVGGGAQLSGDSSAVR
jgi:hypothetical protein